VRLRDSRPRYLLIGPPEAIRDCWCALEPTAVRVGSEAWATLDIEAGMPTLVPATADQFLPQMLNLQSLNGVSFTKGCFVGQEVVSRMEHRGTARTRFVIAASDAPLAPETEIKVGDVRIGEIKSADNTRALALLRLDRAAAAMDKNEAITADGRPLTLSIPEWAEFSFPDQKGA